MGQHHGTYTDADLERVVARDFAPACRDYRDILSDAEYPTYRKARTPDAQEKAIERDWQQLQSWLNRQ